MTGGSSIIDQQYILIQEQGGSITTERLKKSLDVIVTELKKDNLTYTISVIKRTLVSVHIVDMKSYGEPGIVDHQLFVIIRDCYLDILHRWRVGQVLDNLSQEVFVRASSLLNLMCTHVTDANVNRFKELLLHKPLLEELHGCLTEIAANGNYLQDTQIDGVDFMFRAIYHISQGRVQIQNDPLLTPLLDAIVKCVCSPFFASMFKQVTDLKELNGAQTFLLDTCTDYFSWYGGDRRDEFCFIIRTALLSPFTQWLLTHISTFRTWSQVTINAVKKLGNLILDFDMQNDAITREEVHDDCYKIVDSFVFILFSLSNATMGESDIDLAGVFVLQLYFLTLDQDLLSYIKNQHLSPILLKLVDVGNEWVQFNAYRILASILTEQDIKVLANPWKIANVFLTFLTNVIDDPKKILRLRSLLRCLNSKCCFFQCYSCMIPRAGLAQHDQIKAELTKRSALPLLLRCATETKFDPSKEQRPALEILLALAFNDQAAILLKQNLQFISHLKRLLISSPEKRVQRAAEGLLWKLEKEETEAAKPVLKMMTESAATHKYDIMLSYSHSDKDLCHRLHDRLVNDHFRVWIDRDHMYGTTMVAMAEAIENSQFVVICMSDSYKQSVYCRSEAHYAFERQCHFIPIVTKQKYRPDGWLGIIVSGKIYIDFPKLEFDQAYLKLKKEIEQHRKGLSHTTAPKKQLQHDSPTLTTSGNTMGIVPKKLDEQQPAAK